MAEAELSRLKAQLGLRISEDKLRKAFLHSSYVHEHPEAGESNERLEFLGDAVISLAVSEHLYRTCPLPEGELTRVKSLVVSGSTLAQRARELDLQHYLLLGRGEEESGGRERDSLLSDAFEALVGVIFLHSGYEAAAQFVLQELHEAVERALRGEERRDYKTLLQEEAQKQGLRPHYTLLKACGKDHEREFTVQVELNGQTAVGHGRRVKEAEQAAAKALYERLVARE
jgi:ribonuclease-3